MQMQILDSGPSPLSLRVYDAAAPARASLWPRTVQIVERMLPLPAKVGVTGMTA